MKVAKYKLAAFYASCHQQTLPTPPFPAELDKPHHLIGGAAGRFLQRALAGPRREEILQSLKQAKKGMPRPDKKDLDAATEKFKVAITTRPEEIKPFRLDSWDELQHEVDPRIPLTVDKETMKEQLRRTTREIFNRMDEKEAIEIQLKEFFSSTSANYINSRKKGGALGTIFNDRETLLKDLRTPGGAITYSKMSEPKFSEKENKMTFPEDEEITQQKGIKIEKDELLNRFKILLSRIRVKASSEFPAVKPVALAEALKTRMITSMPPYQQLTVNGISKVVQKALLKHEAFRLTGAPVTEEYILNRMGKELKDDEVFLSGDYESATDKIYSEYTETVADEICTILEIPEDIRDAYRTSLTRNMIEIKKATKKTPGEYKEQQVGQLMGSRPSFGILCIENATVTRWALETSSGRLWTLDDARMMINGDDVGAKGNQRLYHDWRRIAGFMGLTESLGKTYVSRDFVDINSTSFTRDKEPHTLITTSEGREVFRTSPFRRTPFVNSGLLNGLKRSSNNATPEQGSTQLLQLGAHARELLELCPEGLEKMTMRMFIKKNKTKMEKAKVPWYIPEWLGGLGLPTGSWGQPSEIDLRLARKILMNWRKIQPARVRPETPWLIWKKATDRLPEPLYTRNKSYATEEYTRIVSIEALSLLFDSAIKMDDIYQLVEEPNRNVLKHNRKLWVPTGNLPAALTEAELAYQPLYPNYEFDEYRTEYERGKAEARTLARETEELKTYVKNLHSTDKKQNKNNNFHHHTYDELINMLHVRTQMKLDEKNNRPFPWGKIVDLD